MELQEKVAVPIFTDVDKDVFVRDIYPEVRLNPLFVSVNATKSTRTSLLQLTWSLCVRGRVTAALLLRPAVLRAVRLGPCLEKWTVEYLGQKGGDKEVKIHVSTVPQMDFLHKNFAYKTLPFNEFVKRASERKHSDFFLCEDESYYLRSLGEDVRREPADLSKQFPDLAEDFNIPQFFAADQFFSSVFRISSCGLQLWTHYDVMDNLLAQVTGMKRVVLYSPQDALHLYLSGDKSEVLDIDSPDLKRFPEFVKAKRYECVLEPGDLLFIPALWFHNTLALQFGVGVNVFWRHLPADSYDKKDPYGNKDPVAASRALQALERALHTLDELPADYRDFYGRRMIQRIQKRTYSDSLTRTATREDPDGTLPSSQLTKPG
ncbi:tRNA wybutosine-synthesizing protein 5 isoform X2 [Dicentrarchus labrax]|uniref:tRNA wybutosine-synthesizing protein 5 isoform X2 n=1 Tax=Dicentrarchus labrax TaxID=13489 RepID=UPI0021F62553|nr:tRNA wybutosine-synthesizing protein 5 isoform X2 [Dicentrarchus labrax]